jgi:hypothetical protein
MLVAGDPGIPKTIAPTGYKNFAPKIGLAYSPRSEQGFLRKIFGANGKSSIRASYGIFYTAFPGLPTGIMYAVPPFGYNYLSPGPPLLATPFITAASGVNNGQRFPFPFPPHNISTSHPDNSINWANFVPLAADPFFYYRNRAPYIDNYMFSFQRQITSTTLRFATGFPVTLYDNSDNSLLGTLSNGANNYLLDTPQHLPESLKINTNGRNGRPAFNTSLFPEEKIGQLGNAKRRIFYGPGINNFDLTLQKDVRLTEARSLEFRAEAFNAFNHSQFYGPASVDGQVDDTENFGHIVSAAAPRLVQLVAKFNF